MGSFWDQNIGKLLLVAAFVWFVAFALKDRPQTLPKELTAPITDPVLVELDPALLAPSSGEEWFPPGVGGEFLRGRTVFVPEKKNVVFQPVELDLPETSVPPMPQLLPDPGPTLEGAANLPRWGEELPPLTTPQRDSRGKTSGRDDRTPRKQ